MTLRTLIAAAFTLLVLFAGGCATPNVEQAKEELDARSTQLQLARAAEQEGAGQKALTIYQALLVATPNDSALLQHTAELASSLGDREFAAQLYGRLATLQPENVAWREEVAMLHIQLGLMVKAQTELQQLTTNHPERWKGWSGLGLIADIDGNYAAASGYHGRAIEQGYNQPTAYNNLGYSQLMAHRYTDAESTLRKGMALAPDSERICNNLLLALAWQGRYEEAVQEGRALFKEWIAYNNVGYIALQRGDYTAAIKLFETALASSPSYYPKAAENLRMARQAKEKK